MRECKMIKITKQQTWKWYILETCCDEMKISIKNGIFKLCKESVIIKNFFGHAVVRCPYCNADIENPEMEW